jgi:hypothetical protein
MDDLTYDKVADAFLSAFPEFQERYGEKLGWWQGPDRPGPYLAFGFVITSVV